MDWDWDYANSILPSLLKGLSLTVQVTLIAAVIAFIVGLALALARRSRHRFIARPVWAAIELIRSTPLLILLFFLFFLLPEVGITLPPLVSGIIGLGVYYSSYAAEAYRAGFQSVPRGQWEAAHALNLPVVHTWTRVILPQSLRITTPFLGNYVIAMFKDSALLSVVTVVELMGAARAAAGLSYRWLEPIAMVGVMYLVISYVASLIVRQMEVRLARK